MREKVIGIDIGGTKTLVGVVDNSGKILTKVQMATDITLSMKEHLEKCIDMAHSCLSELGIEMTDIGGVGLSLPGIADPKKGVLIHAPFVGWKDEPVRQYVQDMLTGLAVEVENDVNACAIGECLFGKGKDFSNFVWVTISTGIGGAIVADNQLVTGEQMIAGEIGHIKVEWENGRLCGCGNMGCLEAHASGTAITNLAKEFLQAEWKNTNLDKYLTENDLPINTKSIAAAGDNGNEEALHLFKLAGESIGRGFSYAVNLLNPGAIICGGGVSQSFHLLEPHIRKVIESAVIGDSNKQVPLLQTDLGYEAGLIGAASLIYKREEDI